MRIAQLLPELNEGGVERGVVELNRELVKHGVESLVVSAGGRLAGQIEKDGGRHLDFDLASKNPLTVPGRILRLRRLLSQLRPDIIHARSRVPAWLAWLANRRLGIPFVTTVHGFNSVNPYSRVMTYGRRVICVSRAIKDYIQTHYQVPEEKIQVIPRGVDLEEFDPERIDREFVADFKARYNLADRFVVTAVGRITQLKDYETFIRGLALAKENIPNLCGLIVGGVRKDKEQYFQSLQQLVADLNAGELVLFVGSQSRMAEIYSLSDLVVSSSKKPESFGRAAAEALAMNVPVIATRHGGVMDLVIPGRTGELIPPENAETLAEAILKLRENRPVELRKMIIDNFSLEKMVAANLDLYKMIVFSASSTERFLTGNGNTDGR